MHKLTVLLVAGALTASAGAIARLPAPTAQEQQAAADKKAADQARVEKEKVALEKAQDRIAARFGKKGGATATGATAEHNLPKTVKEPAEGVGPRPGMPQSAEAHSGQVK